MKHLFSFSLHYHQLYLDSHNIPEIYKFTAFHSHFLRQLSSFTYAPYTVYLRGTLDVFNGKYTHYLCSYWEKMELNLLITGLEGKKK